MIGPLERQIIRQSKHAITTARLMTRTFEKLLAYRAARTPNAGQSMWTALANLERHVGGFPDVARRERHGRISRR